MGLALLHTSLQWMLAQSKNSLQPPCNDSREGLGRGTGAGNQRLSSVSPQLILSSGERAQRTRVAGGLAQRGAVRRHVLPGLLGLHENRSALACLGLQRRTYGSHAGSLAAEANLGGAALAPRHVRWAHTHLTGGIPVMGKLGGVRGGIRGQDCNAPARRALGLAQAAEGELGG
jgi:hypothetical protein